ncbi:MAG: hypothetical protein LBM93_06990 [Oscillospiraceae bacterium]|jgi:hypothetical protein|nr:hypothetical protein [Oscillospiraceae bacterium]
MENKLQKNNVVTVRWWDGYIETFEVNEVRAGAYLLWMRLTNGKNRYVPINQVRWYSLEVESHQEISEETEITIITKSD